MGLRPDELNFGEVLVQIQKQIEEQGADNFVPPSGLMLLSMAARNAGKKLIKDPDTGFLGLR